MLFARCCGLLCAPSVAAIMVRVALGTREHQVRCQRKWVPANALDVSIRLDVALYLKCGELKKVQRMSRPAVKGNVSCAGEGAIIATQRGCDEWTDEAS